MTNLSGHGRLVMTIGLLAILPGCSLAPKSFQGIKNPAPLVRARAIPLGRGLPDTVVVPNLIDHLEDKDQVVRLAAFEELKKRTGQDFGFVPYAEPGERASSVANWKSWWQQRQPLLGRRKASRRQTQSLETQTVASRDGTR